MSRFDFKGEILEELLAKAGKDVESNNLIELEDMLKVLGYTTQDLSNALSKRYRDTGASTSVISSVLRYGTLLGWYAAKAKGAGVPAESNKKSWWTKIWE